ncbi:uncharacterized protein [Dysidea avara]|uniref:uncharacterized protein isoform X3 n=1 Tax=Dysidea avara TaxID=196820 RepID=UPI0033172E5C
MVDVPSDFSPDFSGHIHASTRPTMKDLNKYIIPLVATKWYDLGLDLLDAKHEHLLDIIEGDYKYDTQCCCRKMFSEWLRTTDTPTWDQLIVAIRTINLNEAASKIESLFPQAANNQVDLQPVRKGNKTFTTQFSKLLTKVSYLLDHNCGDRLEMCKRFCSTLCISDASDQLLFGDNQLPQLKASKNFGELFIQLRHHWGWDEWSILEHIIDLVELKEAEDELHKYKQFLASKHAIEIISEEFSDVDLPPNCVSFSIILDKPYSRVSIQEYSRIKEFICGILEINKYVMHPFIKYFIGSLHLQWYVAGEAAAHMIKMAKQNEKALLAKSFVFVKIGEEVVLDCYSQKQEDHSYDGYAATTDDTQFYDTQYDTHGYISSSVIFPGGYDHEFMELVPNRLICMLCKLPCYEAHKCKECGQVYCKHDLDHLKSMTDMSYACPMCHVEPFLTSPYLADHEIKEHTINCPNKNYGCCWIGKLDDLNMHTKDCKCRHVKCHHCGDFVNSTTITNHTSSQCPCYCQHCEITAEREVISKQHKEKCHNYPLSCPNKCGLDDIPRANMSEHRTQCPHEMVTCSNCNVKIVRKNLVTHRRKKHSWFETEHLLCIFIYCISVSIISLAAYISFTGDSDHSANGLWYMTLKHSGDYQEVNILPVILKISDFIEKINNKEQWDSSPFFDLESGHEMCLSIYPDGKDDGEGTHVSVYLFIISFDEKLQQLNDKSLTRPLTVEILNQLSDKDHYNYSTMIVDDTKVLEFPQFISHDFLFSHGGYIVEDTLYFRISYESSITDKEITYTLFFLFWIFSLAITIVIYCSCGFLCSGFHRIIFVIIMWLVVYTVLRAVVWAIDNFSGVTLIKLIMILEYLDGNREVQSEVNAAILQTLSPSNVIIFVIIITIITYFYTIHHPH